MIGSGGRPPAKQMATAAGQGEENPRRNPAAGHAQKPEGFAQPFSLLPITLQLAEIHPWRPFGSCRAFWLSCLTPADLILCVSNHSRPLGFTLLTRRLSFHRG